MIKERLLTVGAILMIISTVSLFVGYTVVNYDIDIQKYCHVHNLTTQEALDTINKDCAHNFFCFSVTFSFGLALFIFSTISILRTKTENKAKCQNVQ